MVHAHARRPSHEPPPSLRQAEEAPLLASAGADGGALLWRAGPADDAPLRRCATLERAGRGQPRLQCAAALPGEPALCTGTGDGRCRVYDVRMERRCAEHEAHDGTVWALAAPPADAGPAGARLLFSAGEDGRVRASDLRGPQV